jgi:L-amino acid N-acyltransferase YncA
MCKGKERVCAGPEGTVVSLSAGEGAEGWERPIRADLRAMRADDWSTVAAIYGQGIADGQATFETEVPIWDAWDRAHLSVGRLVACVAGEAAGWGALSPISTRRAYAGVAEVSLYVARAHRGLGVGRALLCRLVAESEGAGLWTLQAGIFPENLASLTLFRDCGFREVGRRERIGQLRGEWRDVLLLERRL